MRWNREKTKLDQPPERSYSHVYQNKQGSMLCSFLNFKLKILHSDFLHSNETHCILQTHPGQNSKPSVIQSVKWSKRELNLEVLQTIYQQDAILKVLSLTVAMTGLEFYSIISVQLALKHSDSMACLESKWGKNWQPSVQYDSPTHTTMLFTAAFIV